MSPFSLFAGGDGAGVLVIELGISRVVAGLDRTLDGDAVTLGVLADEVGRLARRARPWHRTVPGGERAVRVARAAEERAPPLRAALGDVAAAIVRTGHADGHGARPLAVGVLLARQELPEAAALDQHGPRARGALLVGRNLGQQLDAA